ncbi:MAG: GNAT family N-acetyltransferase [Planctomycetales bacterium]
MVVAGEGGNVESHEDQSGAGQGGQADFGESGESLDVRVVTNIRDWDLIGEAWAELFRDSVRVSAALQFSWLWHWWGVFGQACGRGTDRFRIITVWRGTQLVAGLPLYETTVPGTYRRLKCLRFLSTGEAGHEETAPHYLDLLVRPGCEEASLQAVWRTLATMTWDVIDLQAVPEESVLVRGIAGHWPQTLVDPPRPLVHVYANLEGGFESYLLRRSGPTRKILRRRMREAEAAGARFELATPETIDEFFDDLVRLHQERRIGLGGAGVFAAPRFLEFQRRIAREWLADGRAAMGRLSIGDEAVAIQYGFIARQTFEAYQCGLCEGAAGEMRSPGITCHLLLMAELAKRGITSYDLRRAGATYKQDLITNERTVLSVRIWRVQFQRRLMQWAQRARGAIRGLAKRGEG